MRPVTTSSAKADFNRGSHPPFHATVESGPTDYQLAVVLFPDQWRDGAGQVAWGARSFVRVDPEAVARVSRDVATALNALPVRLQGRVLTVAMPNPGEPQAIRTLVGATGLRIRPAQASPEDLHAAIRHFYYRDVPRESLQHSPLGELLLARGLLTKAQLEGALLEQRRTGERLGRVLVSQGVINRLVLSELLAEQLGLPHVNLRETPPESDVVRLLDPILARRLSSVPVRWIGQQLLVAMEDPRDDAAREELRNVLGVPLAFAVASGVDVDWVLDRAHRGTLIEESVSGLLYRSPEESAYVTFTNGQIAAGLALVVAAIAALALAPAAFLIGLNAVFAALYTAISLYRLWLAYRGASTNLTIQVNAAEVAQMNERELPMFTLLIPVFRERDVIQGLVQSIESLDYPRAKLDVLLLFEESDRDTLEAAMALRPPAMIRFVVVPDSVPRTKPKALNFGLASARGQYAVVYDAEDRPEPDQLKRVVAAFRRAPPDVICLQAKLNYYNRHQNILTRWFTSEYSTWFDLILPGLDSTLAPIPLGGTSNHFVLERLRELGGWDPFNVTEDADLGIRMFKRGYRAAIVDSTTYEEANSELGNWIRQRSRWVKGYMQTWLVNMRHPLHLLLALGWRASFSFHATVGGTPLVFLLNPIYWTITTLWFLTHWQVIPPLFPGPVYYLSLFNLVVGNFVFAYLNLAGTYRRGYYELSGVALLTPIYWMMMSLAAWRALWQLLAQPFQWEKTTHGLDRRRWRPFVDPLYARRTDRAA